MTRLGQDGVLLAIIEQLCSLWAVVLLSLAALIFSTLPPRVTERHTGPPPPPHRVVILNPYLARYITADDGPGHIAGTSDFAGEVLDNPLLRFVYPGAGAIPRVSHSNAPNNLEALLAVHPDAALVWPQAVPRLKRLGIPNVIGIQGYSGDLSRTIIHMQTMMGAVTGRMQRASALLRRWRAAIARLADLLPRPAPPFEIVALYPGEGVGIIGGGHSYLNPVIEFIGAHNPAGDGPWAPAGLERLIALNPDMIVLGADYRRSPCELFSDSAWQPLQAIRERRVYSAPRLPDIDGPVDGPLYILWLAQLRYGNRIPNLWRQMLVRTYRATYGVSPPERVIDQVLQVDANRCSRGYHRLLANDAAAAGDSAQVNSTKGGQRPHAGCRGTPPH